MRSLTCRDVGLDDVCSQATCERLIIMRQFTLVGWPQVGPSALTAGIPAAVVGRIWTRHSACPPPQNSWGVVPSSKCSVKYHVPQWQFPTTSCCPLDCCHAWFPTAGCSGGCAEGSLKYGAWNHDPFFYGVPSGTIPPTHAQEFYRDRLADGWKWIRVERLCKENNIPNYRMMRDLKKHRATGPKLIWDLGMHARGSWHRY